MKAPRRTGRVFEHSYAISLTTATLALVPYIVVASASASYRDQIAADIGVDRTAVEVVDALATAAYAFGALVGGDLIQRFRLRILFLACEALFVVAGLICAAAPGIVLFGAGAVLQGLTTGLLLIIALPSVIRRFPPDRLPISAAAVNIGFFGALTIGPLVGGIVADGHAWRPFELAVAGTGGLTFLLALFTIPDQPPMDPDLPVDVPGLALGLGAAVLPFWAVAQLRDRGFGSPVFLVPLSIGLACFVALLFIEYRKEHPLAPVRLMWHTFPLVGTLAAMLGGAVFISLDRLAEQVLLRILHLDRLTAGITFWPGMVGAIMAAVLFGFILRTKWLPVFIFAGMLLLIAGGTLMLPVDGPSATTMRAANALLGLGAGATVSPGLYLAGLSLPSRILGRTFALVELVRSIADFMLAPVILEVARSSGPQGDPTAAIGLALLITLLIAAVSTLAGVTLYVLGGTRLPQPNLTAWLREDRPAFESPAVGKVLRANQRGESSRRTR